MSLQPESRIIRVVVIDDSAFMRKSITLMLESDPTIKVVASARDGVEGLEKVVKHQPDIVTLDVEMPGLDGLAVLKAIMEKNPLPVLMVSSLTTEGAQATMAALDLGAVDFISKDMSFVSLSIVNIKDELVAKVKEIANSRSIRTRFRLSRLAHSTGIPSTPARRPSPQMPSFNASARYQAVAIGISTGGPHALIQVLPRLPEKFPVGVAIVQHMPPHFTRTLAERLNSLSEVFVKEAEDGEPMEPGKVLIAPGGKQMTFDHRHGTVSVVISDGDRQLLYRPSADVMMEAVANACPGPVVGVIMTGMGKDGVEGLKVIKTRGGIVLAQDEESCVVYGMPKVAVSENVVDQVVSLQDIPAILQHLVVRS